MLFSGIYCASVCCVPKYIEISILDLEKYVIYLFKLLLNYIDQCWPKLDVRRVCSRLVTAVNMTLTC